MRSIEIPSLDHASYAERITMLAEANTIHYDSLRNKINDFGQDVRLLLTLGGYPRLRIICEPSNLDRESRMKWKESSIRLML